MRTFLRQSLGKSLVLPCGCSNCPPQRPCMCVNGGVREWQRWATWSARHEMPPGVEAATEEWTGTLLMCRPPLLRRIRNMIAKKALSLSEIESQAVLELP